MGQMPWKCSRTTATNISIMIYKVEIALKLTVTIPMITAALWAHLLKEVACLQISTMMVQPKLFARDLGRLGSTIGNKVKFGNITSVWVKSSISTKSAFGIPTENIWNEKVR